MKPLALLICCLLAAGCDAASRGVPVDRVAPVKAAEPPLIVVHAVHGEPVSVALQLSQGRAAAGQAVELSVRLTIAPPWEIRALDSQPESISTRLALALPPGLEARGPWRAPPTVPSHSDEGYPSYSGMPVFSLPIAVGPAVPAGDYPIRLSASYQACNGSQCLRPTAVELAVTLRVE